MNPAFEKLVERAKRQSVKIDKLLIYSVSHPELENLSYQQDGDELHPIILDEFDEKGNRRIFDSMASSPHQALGKCGEIFDKNDIPDNLNWRDTVKYAESLERKFGLRMDLANAPNDSKKLANFLVPTNREYFDFVFPDSFDEFVEKLLELASFTLEGSDQNLIEGNDGDLAHFIDDDELFRCFLLLTFTSVIKRKSFIEIQKKLLTIQKAKFFKQEKKFRRQLEDPEFLNYVFFKDLDVIESYGAGAILSNYYETVSEERQQLINAILTLQRSNIFRNTRPKIMNQGSRGDSNTLNDIPLLALWLGKCSTGETYSGYIKDSGEYAVGGQILGFINSVVSFKDIILPTKAQNARNKITNAKHDLNFEDVMTNAHELWVLRTNGAELTVKLEHLIHFFKSFNSDLYTD